MRLKETKVFSSRLLNAADQHHQM